MAASDILKRTWDSLMDRTGWACVGDFFAGKESDADTLLEVPGYTQTQTYTCGFVAGLMVLHTFKPKASINSFWKRLRPRESDGVSNTGLIKALRQSGIGVRVVKDINFGKFAGAINEGFPVITLVKTKETDSAHWVVVYGVGESPNRVFVAGNGLPFLSKRVVRWNTFRHQLSGEKLGLVCWGK